MQLISLLGLAVALFAHQQSAVHALPTEQKTWILSLEGDSTASTLDEISAMYGASGLVDASSRMEMLDIAGFKAVIAPAGDQALRGTLEGSASVAQIESPKEWTVSLPQPEPLAEPQTTTPIVDLTSSLGRSGSGSAGRATPGRSGSQPKKSADNDEARKQQQARESQQPAFNPAAEINKLAGGGGGRSRRSAPGSGGATARNPITGSNSAVQNAGQGVIVFVIDTGIDVNHAAFKGVNGRSRALIKDYTGEGNNDQNGHGTHVAGTAVGQDFGIARGATVMSLKVFTAEGKGANDRILRALRDVGKFADGKRPLVVNMSLGGPKGNSTSATQRAIQALSQRNVAVVVAAGNENQDACNVSPAFVPQAVTVGAADANGRRASFSNAGKCVQVTAPGVNVVSAKPGGGTTIKSGTSMASPVIAGTMASLMGQGLTAKAAQQRLLQMAVSPVTDTKGSPNRAVSRQDIAKAVLRGGEANQGGKQKNGGVKETGGEKTGEGKTNANPRTPPPTASPKAVFGVPAFGSAGAKDQPAVAGSSVAPTVGVPGSGTMRIANVQGALMRNLGIIAVAVATQVLFLA